MPENGHWIVRRAGQQRVKTTFAKKSDAVAAAHTLARRTQPAQVTTFYRNGRMEKTYGYGLPQLPRLPYRSAIRDEIERAVLKVADLQGR
jgi:Uncharacterized protein conserved in bacteria (DUF2188)